jgi:hypothetical protein
MAVRVVASRAHDAAIRSGAAARTTWRSKRPAQKLLPAMSEALERMGVDEGGA